jgi:hypothetical protein
MMERRVETDNLPECWAGGSYCADWHKVVRHVERVEWRQRFQLGQQPGSDHLGRDMIRSAMYDPMAGGRQPIAPEMSVRELQQLMQGGAKGIPGGAPPLLRKNGASGVAREKVRLRFIEVFDFAPDRDLQRSGIEQSEFQA